MQHTTQVAPTPSASFGFVSPKPLTRPDIARGYSSAYLIARALPSNYMLPEHYEILQRVIAYLGYRYNCVTMRGTAFMPKAWAGMPRVCEDCGGYGDISSRGYDSDDVSTEKCQECSGTGTIGGAVDTERAL